MIERNVLANRLHTKANAKEREKVKELNIADYEEDGRAAVAMCRYVKAIYNYMDTVKLMRKKGITEEQMNRQRLFHRGTSMNWNEGSLGKVKKVAEECRKD